MKIKKTPIYSLKKFVLTEYLISGWKDLQIWQQRSLSLRKLPFTSLLSAWTHKHTFFFFLSLSLDQNKSLRGKKKPTKNTLRQMLHNAMTEKIPSGKIIMAD